MRRERERERERVQFIPSFASHTQAVTKQAVYHILFYPKLKSKPIYHSLALYFSMFAVLYVTGTHTTVLTEEENSFLLQTLTHSHTHFMLSLFAAIQ